MASQKTVSQSLIETSTTFDSFGLDQRIIKAISKLNWKNPTLIQASAIPLALKGKDILGRARTGSGKTGAYAIPIIQKILVSKQRGGKNQKGIKALILVPTKELTEQVKTQLQELFSYCARELSVYHLATDQIPAIQKPRLEELPDIVVATPGRLLLHLNAGNLVLNLVETLVIDEADLMLSYGFEKDLKTILRQIPTFCQTFLMSATLSSDVEALKSLYLHNPVILKLEEPEKSGQLSQFFVQCPSNTEKYLTLYCLIKFQVIVGKIIVFTNEILTCYQIKLFLERFFLKSAVLNSELPQNSRMHVIKEFNRGAFDILIATDESLISAEDRQNSVNTKKKKPANVEEVKKEQPEVDEMDVESEENIVEENENEDADQEKTEENDEGEEKNEEEEADENENEEDDDQEKTEENDEGEEKNEEEEEKMPKIKLPSVKLNRRNKKRRFGGDKEYGIARGLDFKNVAAVINFDLPFSFKGYIHRIGRTARATAKGTALTFVLPNAQKNARNFERKLKDSGATVKPLEVKKDNLDRFRYRVEDILRGITPKQVNEARLAEIKAEILNSEKLKTHFEENPADYHALTHHQSLLSTKSYKHLQVIPDYLMPENKEDQITTPFKRNQRKKGGRVSRDPLKNLSLRSYTKMGKPIFKGQYKDGGHAPKNPKKSKKTKKSKESKRSKGKPRYPRKYPKSYTSKKSVKDD